MTATPASPTASHQAAVGTRKAYGSLPARYCWLSLIVLLAVAIDASSCFCAASA
jgi:hypothetical protein